MLNDRFLQFFINQNKLTEEQAKKFLEESKSMGISLEEYLIDYLIIPEEDILEYKSTTYKLPVAELYGKTISPDILRIIPRQVAENYRLVAFGKEGNVLKVALSDPSDFKAREAVSFLAREKGLAVEYYVAGASTISKILAQYKGLAATVKEVVSTTQSEFASQIEEAKMVIGKKPGEAVEAAPITRLVDSFLNYAVEHKASDLHIEALGDEKTRIRCRIDGLLRETAILPIYLHSAIVARIKVMANLKLDETRIPQDGRVAITMAKRKVDLRVSVLPLLDKEKVVIRILDPLQRITTLEDLGFWGKDLEIIKKELNRPYGLFLATGPTGCGKTTTLYAILKILNKAEVNIVSLEDPVEYYLEGVNQSQIKPQLGYTFATGLRSVVRQDPDIIMVGEIRDNETAELAVHSALTGHIVLSTLHTNNAIGTIPRLIDMKIEPFLLSSCLNFVIGQRLVRKICPKCKEEYLANTALNLEIEKMFKEVKDVDLYEFRDKKTGQFRLYKGKGCAYCGQEGYVGRTVIFEVAHITDRLREMISNREDINKIEQEVISKGMLPIIKEGYLKALKGITTLEEILRVSEE